MESVLFVGLPTGITWGLIARHRRRSIGSIVLSAIIGTALWGGFVIAINMIMPTEFERNMLRQMQDAVFSFMFIFIPAGAASIGFGTLCIPCNRQESNLVISSNN